MRILPEELYLFICDLDIFAHIRKFSNEDREWLGKITTLEPVYLVVINFCEFSRESVTRICGNDSEHIRGR
jgi:hypothetical protein